jgi:chromosome segregation ATPase
MEVLKRMITLADEDVYSVEVTISETDDRIRELNSSISNLRSSVEIMNEHHMCLDDAIGVIYSKIKELDQDHTGALIRKNDLLDRLKVMENNRAAVIDMVRRVCSHVEKSFDYYDPHECGDIYVCDCCSARVLVK